MKSANKKAIVITYGCRQNNSDSGKIKAKLASLGYGFCLSPKNADLVIFNTCAVREGAEDRVYGNIGALSSAFQENKKFVVGVMGCMSGKGEVQARLKKTFPQVRFALGASSAHLLPEVLEKVDSGERVFLLDDDKKDIKKDIIEEASLREDEIKIIADVPIMQGCNNFCSYCIVPYVRGREKSRDSKNILEEIKILAREGYKEILLLGQNVNSYRSDIDFPELLDRVNQIPRIERIRFISSHPKDISEKLIDAMARNEKVCSLLHLPFQSGSDKVLKDMNRNYTRARYMEIIQMAREKIPNISISSDCIVGFPTEDMEAFEDTLDLVSKIKFDSLFTFIYSRRKGTRAYDLPSRLDEAAIKNNFQRLVDLQKNIGLEKNKSMIGKIEKVLAEGVSKNNPDKYTGRTNGGKIVNFKSRENPIGKIVDVKIINAKSFNLEGEV